MKLSKSIEQKIKPLILKVNEIIPLLNTGEIVITRPLKLPKHIRDIALLDKIWIDRGNTVVFGPGPYLHVPYLEDGEELAIRVRCPLGYPAIKELNYPKGEKVDWKADRLWVREAFILFESVDNLPEAIVYKIDNEERYYVNQQRYFDQGSYFTIDKKYYYESFGVEPAWQPASKMQRWMSRLEVEVMSVEAHKETSPITMWSWIVKLRKVD